ncbi:rhomboid family intramembrane serine protease [Tateyamaria armeniaca]|uniref:Rhomboid family intramembrane serine protease n=1 Tax=Tateyamaria armeniaca TaxID=2518930 RepID=A0ABW8URR0_9RHOB
MTSPAPPDARRQAIPWPGTVIAVLMILTCGLELAVAAADVGLIGSVRWRSLILQYGACWPGLVRDWQPNYAAQPWTMFFSYSLLHAGLLHLLGNMAMLLWVGPGLAARVGQLGFLLLWVGSVLGGGLVFVAMASASTPMVGASGAVFGLIGALVMYDYVLKGRYAKALGISAALALLNLVMLIAENGLLAWQTHLGGYLAGGLIALCLTDRQPEPAATD